MILLIGGTSETAPLAEAVAAAGFKVLVSTATQVPLGVGKHPNISSRSGKLDGEGMAQLAAKLGVRAIVDASHPYSLAARTNARKVAEDLNIPYFRWVRPPVATDGDYISFATDHESAARAACSFGLPVLLTTGSRNIIPYASEADRTGTLLVVRVLPHPDSVEACRRAGVPDEHIVKGRGPFSVEANRAVIREFGIGTLVTKDSGVEGGFPAKIEAARLENCRVVVVQRPNEISDQTFSSMAELVDAVSQLLPSRSASCYD
jgi:precorrin-6A/cobalt-precorrin-6A reductase